MASRPAAYRLALMVVGWLLAALPALANIQLPVADLFAPIEVTGERAVRWQQNAVELWVVQQCVIRQGEMTARGEQAVLWVDRGSAMQGKDSQVTVYLEGSAAIDFQRDGQAHPETGRAAQSIRDHSWFGRLVANAPVTFMVADVTQAPQERPAVYQRGVAEFERQSGGPVRPVQYTPLPPTMPPQVLPPGNVSPVLPQGMAPPALPPGTISPPAMLAPPTTIVQPPTEPLAQPPLAPFVATEKRVQVGPRSNSLIHIKSFPGSLANQSVTVFSNGIRAVIEGLQAPELGYLGRIVIETDRLVLWGPNLKTLSSSGSEVQGGPEVPIEVYMEGNIVFRQGDRLIYADRMYYNATHEYGVVLAAEVFTPVPDFQGMVRLKADVLQQLNQQHFQAYGAAVTTSQMGVPTYWFQSEKLEFRDRTQPVINPVTGTLEMDPRTNEAAVSHDMMATSRNNALYVGGWPVFYWPTMATSLEKPNYYIERFAIKNDNVFGTQLLADWDLYQLLRIEKPLSGTEWLLSTDYLSERGFGLGTTFEYQRDGCCNYPGPVNGWFDAWGINDSGLDDLGLNRRAVEPDTEWRGRVHWRHRQEFPNGCQFTAQLGLLSDRNFLEQYFEREWDEWKDRTTSLELKRSWDGQSLRVLGQVRLNESVSQTEWLPRLDHFLIGRSLLKDHLTWFAHSQAGYARFQTLDPPSDPQDANGWMFLPWERPDETIEGGRFATRQEIDLPLQVGGLKVVPYLLGEAAFWQETLDGQDVTRAYGQVGLRTSLPFWRTDPTVQSLLFNLNGMAHKVTLVGDLFWSDANQDITEFPLYDPLDDDSQEHFRRYLGVIPWEYDPRNFAFRSRMQSWVSSPTTEMVDDLSVARLGAHQRWQTKRGLPGHQRVVDWITLDLDASVFPNADRDNFGETIGQLEYDFRWHIGDRTTILSDGYADLFPGAFQAISIGTAISRPQRGQLYAGVITMDGPVSATALVGSLTYRLSTKWIIDLSSIYDFGDTGNIGERFGITRVGESALIRIALNADHGRDNYGASFLIEPRFLPNGRLGRIAGAQIPPVGAMGLE